MSSAAARYWTSVMAPVESIECTHTALPISSAEYRKSFPELSEVPWTPPALLYVALLMVDCSVPSSSTEMARVGHPPPYAVP